MVPYRLHTYSYHKFVESSSIFCSIYRECRRNWVEIDCVKHNNEQQMHSNGVNKSRIFNSSFHLSMLYVMWNMFFRPPSNRIEQKLIFAARNKRANKLVKRQKNVLYFASARMNNIMRSMCLSQRHYAVLNAVVKLK